MRVAGLGFRQAAPPAALHEALEAALRAARLDAQSLDALATIAPKAEAPALRALARATGLPIIAIAPDALPGVATATHSPRLLARFGTGSLAEAAALLAAQSATPARLLASRHVSTDGMATCAIAERTS